LRVRVWLTLNKGKKKGRVGVQDRAAKVEKVLARSGKMKDTSWRVICKDDLEELEATERRKNQLCLVCGRRGREK